MEETLRPNEPEAPIEGMDSCGDEKRFFTICGRPASLETSALKERRKAREERAAKPRPKAAK